MMKKTIFAVLVLISNITFSKNHETFIGFNVSNGRTMFKNRFTYNDVKSTVRQKLFYTGVFLNYGGTIKNVSIYSGIGYNLYQFDYAGLDFAIDFNGIGFTSSGKLKRNYSLINIPINVDYNINLFKQKLFFVVGTGMEISVTFKDKIKSDNKNIVVNEYDLSNVKKASFAITARAGLLYNINKRFDIYAYFDFKHHINRYLTVKQGVDYGTGRNGTYPYIIAGSLGFNVKLYKKAKESVQQK